MFLLPGLHLNNGYGVTLSADVLSSKNLEAECTKGTRSTCWPPPNTSRNFRETRVAQSLFVFSCRVFHGTWQKVSVAAARTLQNVLRESSVRG